MSDQETELAKMRHSLAHIMASAIQKKWPNAKFGVGPAIDNGFYYDVDTGEKKISEDDFTDLEKAMQSIISENQTFEHIEKPIDDAISWAKDTNQTYKEELLMDLKRAGTTQFKDLKQEELGTITDSGSKVDTASFYKNGDFTDLCSGPHVSSTGEVGVFKLHRISGVYWRGKEKNPQMQRIYGLAFKEQKELDDYLAMLEEAKKRDHRKLGQELDLYLVSSLVGSGLPLFTPRGTILREELNRFSQELREREGYQKVWTPHIAKKELYEVSGHWEKFGDEWLKVASQETNDELVMKPMNCPHHQQIYASRPRSYRELPIKYMETTTDYRDEKAGELLGLARVRSLTQDDSHAFCTPDQIKEIMAMLVAVVKEFYDSVGLSLRVRLSYRDDSDGYLGSPELWQRAQSTLKEVVEDSKLEYFIAEGEAAFYGPKIDFLAKDALGREIQVATPQLDFVQPERFKLTYIDHEGHEKTPVMIHFALLGSIERFLSIYIEHTAGKFPVWVAPEQIRLITVNQEDNTVKFAESLVGKAKSLGLRVNLDNSNESVGKKIRSSEVYKVPYTVVIGDKEIDSANVTPRVRADLFEDGREVNAMPIDDFFAKVVEESKNRVNKSTV